MTTLYALLICLIYCLAMTCLGAVLLPLLGRNRFPADDLPASAWLTTAFLLGAGVLANVWLLSSLAGWFTPAVVAGGLGVCLLAGARPGWRLLANCRPGLRALGAEIRQESWPAHLLGISCLFLLVFQSLEAIVLPLPFHGDGAAFYMALPRTIVYTHRLAPLPGFDYFSSIGMSGELHFAALMALGLETLAKVIVWPMSLAAGLLLLALGRQAGLGVRGLWILLCLLWTSEAYQARIWDGKVDLFATALAMAAYYWAFQAGQSRTPLALRLAGLFCGLAVVAKFSFGAALVPGVVLLLIWPRGQTGSERPRLAAWLRDSARSSGLLLLWMAVAFLPHWLKNTALFHEPLAPFFFFAQKHETLQSSWLNQAWIRPDHVPYVLATYPLALVLGSYPMQGGTISCLALAFAPLALWLPWPRSWRGSVLMQLTLAGVAGVGVWMAVRPAVVCTRYILPPLLLLLLGAARAAEHFSLREPRPRLVSAAIVAGLLLMQAHLISLYDRSYDLPATVAAYACGTLSPTEECGQRRAIEAINRLAGANDRVFLAIWSRYWLRADLLVHLNTAKSSSHLRLLPSPAHRWADLQHQGYRYLVIDCHSHPDIAKLLGLDSKTGRITAPPPGLVLIKQFQEKQTFVFEFQPQEEQPVASQIRIDLAQASRY